MKFKKLEIILAILLISNVFSQLVSPKINIMRQQISGVNAQKIIPSADKLIIRNN
ncbi:MAG: hypothetical protein L6407_02225 [Candidatus Delongbacteria bacterium]|nr:hypothetical protein [Candidatus Delongbacteria bacterium]